MLTQGDLLSGLLRELTNTHPSTESRIQRAWQQLPAACRSYTEAGGWRESAPRRTYFADDMDSTGALASMLL